jgi:hypothetical protein
MRDGENTPRPAVGLIRVSTAEQGNSGLGLEAEQTSIRSFVAAPANCAFFSSLLDRRAKTWHRSCRGPLEC